MRTVVIVLVAEGVEAALLAKQVGARGACGLGFERAMEAFMAAVLFRVA
jgi:hypothetical protein